MVLISFYPQKSFFTPEGKNYPPLDENTLDKNVLGVLGN